MHWFNDMQRASSSPENAVRLMSVASNIDVADLLPQVKVPTLVLHSRHDAVVPFEQGLKLARDIPTARFVALDSRNHLLLEHEPAWPRFMDEIGSFLSENDLGAKSNPAVPVGNQAFELPRVVRQAPRRGARRRRERRP